MAKGSRKKLTVIGPHLGAKKMGKVKTHGKAFGGK